MGWTVAHVYKDIESAHRPGVYRPEFERLLIDLADRNFDALVVAAVDRLIRQPGDFERVLNACTDQVTLRSVSEPIDANDPMRVAVGRMFALFAGLESDMKSRRLQDTNRIHATAGTPPATGVYGRSSDCTVIVEPEAAIIRECVHRVINGDSLRMIAEDLTDRGITRRSGKSFTPGVVSYMVCHPAICGDRVYRNEVVALGCWEPIVSRLDQAQARNIASSGHAKRGPRLPLMHLLAGLLTCGRCGGPIVGKGQRQYCCVGGCGRVTIEAALIDPWVTAQVLSRLRKRWPQRGFRTWSEASTNEAIAALNRESDVLKVINRARWLDADLSYLEWRSLRDALALTTAQRIARLGPRRPPGLPPKVRLHRLAEIWDSLPLTTRRDVLGMEAATFVVQPAPSRAWHPSRIQPQWLLPDPSGWEPAPAPRRTRRTPPMWDKSWHPHSSIPNAPELLTRGGPMNLAEAVRITGLGRSTLMELINHGELPRSKINGRWHYDPATLIKIRQAVDTNEAQRRARATASGRPRNRHYLNPTTETQPTSDNPASQPAPALTPPTTKGL